MAKKPEPTRVPQAVGSIPLVGDLMRNADAQARWMQDLLEQNARLIGQLPDTVRSFNDALERFNQTVARLDRAVTQLESASRRLIGPVDRIVTALDRMPLRDLPDLLRRLAGRDAPGRSPVPPVQPGRDQRDK